MRKITLAFIVGLLIAGFAFCQAAEKPAPPRPQNTQPQGAPPQPPVGNEMMGPRMMPMGPGMMPQMNNAPQAAMVASGDGGVIVLFGNRLLKFDKNLNLVKEVKLNTGKDKEMPGMGPGSTGGPQPPAGQNPPRNKGEQH